MKEIGFAGFTEGTFRFFNDLKENNYKPWFDEHKYIYEQEVLQPLKALAVAMTPAMYSIDPEMDFRPNKLISRIYRDVRFSRDKSPYKTCMWMVFERLVTNWENFPGFYMEISTEGYQYGMGLFAPKKKVMDDYRSKIEYEQDHFKEITNDLISKHGFSIGGEEYKRSLKNDLTEYFQPWVQRKSIYLYKKLPVGKELFKDTFAQQLVNEFVLLQPFYEFLVDISE